MCQKCADAMDKYFPNLTDEEKMDILWNATAFPAGCGETVARQLKEAKESTDGSYGGVMEWSQRKLNNAI